MRSNNKLIVRWYQRWVGQFLMAGGESHYSIGTEQVVCGPNHLRRDMERRNPCQWADIASGHLLWVHGAIWGTESKGLTGDLTRWSVTVSGYLRKCIHSVMNSWGGSLKSWKGLNVIGYRLGCFPLLDPASALPPKRLWAAGVRKARIRLAVSSSHCSTPACRNVAM